MNEVSYIITGWLIGIITMLIAKWLDSFKEQKKNENKIISDALVFLFEARDMFNEIAICLASLHEMGEKFPDKRNQLEKDLYVEAESIKEKAFFPKLMFHSFQLQTLRDQSFYLLFERIIKKYKEFHNNIISQKSMEEIEDLNQKIMILTKEIIEKSKTKIKKRI